MMAKRRRLVLEGDCRVFFWRPFERGVVFDLGKDHGGLVRIVLSIVDPDSYCMDSGCGCDENPPGILPGLASELLRGVLATTLVAGELAKHGTWRVESVERLGGGHSEGSR